MILNITTTHEPATDLGFLLHKHPDSFQSVELSVGKAHVFYPEVSHSRTTASLLLDVDPVDMVRQARNLSGDGFSLGHYVNDRPFVASSFLSVAIARAFSSALNGKCTALPELADMPIPLSAQIAVLPASKGGEPLIRKLFEPLGYKVEIERHLLDDAYPDWGQSKYFTITLEQTIELKLLLSHLYVLIPVLDNDKHYFVSKNEIDKLLDKGKNWLPEHPEKKLITQRYLFNLASLTRQALERLEDAPEITDEVPIESPQKQHLHERRLDEVYLQLVNSGAQSVLDLGCGEGKLLRKLLANSQFTRIVGMDVAHGELMKAHDRLRVDSMPTMQRNRLELIQGSLIYRDKRLHGFDAAAVVEVIEHLDESRLSAFEKVLFGNAKPQTVILTTPNREYNVMWEQLPAGTMRHDDHRFEWTREEFREWSERIAAQYLYSVAFFPVGDEHPEVGAPSQMAVFTHGN